MLSPTWKSTFGRKATWEEADVTTVATSVLNELPADIKALVSEGNFKSDTIIGIKDEVGWNVCEKDIRNNYVILKPFVQWSPASVPSAFFAADVLIKLNSLLHNKLFACREEFVVPRATKEGGKIKKLIGALRALYRHARLGKCHEITSLKSYLLPSPTRSRNRQAAESAEE
mmetsp:Transcript_7595/g.17005  ORF Transcript_7595/g.17005 Transcript_7595/m.17005 type:complete len:172 (+) Transcript_7595:78-593(+)